MLFFFIFEIRFLFPIFLKVSSKSTHTFFRNALNAHILTKIKNEILDLYDNPEQPYCQISLPCIMAVLSWKFHLNLFILFPVMLHTVTPSPAETNLKDSFSRNDALDKQASKANKRRPSHRWVSARKGNSSAIAMELRLFSPTHRHNHRRFPVDAKTQITIKVYA